MHFAICLSGLIRSVHYVIGSYRQFIIGPIKAAGHTYDTFLHTSSLNGTYSNPRNKEAATMLNITDCQLFEPNYVYVESREEFEERFPYQLFTAHGIPWENEQHKKMNNLTTTAATDSKQHEHLSFRNYLQSLNSLYHLSAVVASMSRHTHYDYIIFLRTDMKFLQPIPINLLAQYPENTVFLPDFRWSCYEYNDRFAMASLKAGLIYGQRLASALEFSYQQQLHAEKFLFKYLHNQKKMLLTVVQLAFRCQRIRAQGGVEARDVSLLNADEMKMVSILNKQYKAYFNNLSNNDNNKNKNENSNNSNNNNNNNSNNKSKSNNSSSNNKNSYSSCLTHSMVHQLLKYQQHSLLDHSRNTVIYCPQDNYNNDNKNNNNSNNNNNNNNNSSTNNFEEQTSKKKKKKNPIKNKNNNNNSDHNNNNSSNYSNNNNINSHTSFNINHHYSNQRLDFLTVWSRNFFNLSSMQLVNSNFSTTNTSMTGNKKNNNKNKNKVNSDDSSFLSQFCIQSPPLTLSLLTSVSIALSNDSTSSSSNSSNNTSSFIDNASVKKKTKKRKIAITCSHEIVSYHKLTNSNNNNKISNNSKYSNVSIATSLSTSKKNISSHLSSRILTTTIATVSNNNESKKKKKKTSLLVIVPYDCKYI